MNKNSITDYQKYRGKCRQYCNVAIIIDSELQLVKGYYYCPIDDVYDQHWWTVNKKTGEVFDPTKNQFKSRGQGVYHKYTGQDPCYHCGKWSDTVNNINSGGRFIFCSDKCWNDVLGLTK